MKGNALTRIVLGMGLMAGAGYGSAELYQNLEKKAEGYNLEHKDDSLTGRIMNHPVTIGIVNYGLLAVGTFMIGAVIYSKTEDRKIERMLDDKLLDDITGTRKTFRSNIDNRSLEDTPNK